GDILPRKGSPRHVLPPRDAADIISRATGRRLPRQASDTMSEHSDTPQQIYGERYYENSRSGSGLPYSRIPAWLNFFGSVADHVVKDIGPRTVLDVGCAKGFLVEALRDRGVDAYGLDVSEYAIGQPRDDIRGFCSSML